MKRELVKTADGSNTLLVPDLDEHYHSIHGALAEARHVFIKHGLNAIKKNELSIMEMGFGTGLNAFLTFLENQQLQRKITYTSIEAYPVALDVAENLGYVKLIGAEKNNDDFQLMHSCTWGQEQRVDESFTFLKRKEKIQDVLFSTKFDLVYYDAFAPRVQPDLWTEEVFAKIYSVMNPGARLVTYCAKGSVKRALKAVGFEVESLEGPPGKREMTRAKKSK